VVLVLLDSQFLLSLALLGVVRLLLLVGGETEVLVRDLDNVVVEEGYVTIVLVFVCNILGPVQK
jgi:hypothetical protein